ncbi:MAG: hypothetical protein Q4G31_00335 [bacterium]|nr:hypothetical protein [bacterium]
MMKNKKAPTAAGTAISATMPKHENSDIISGIDLGVNNGDVSYEWKEERRSITLTNMQWFIVGEAVRSAISDCEDTARSLAALAIKKESDIAVIDSEISNMALGFRERAMALREILRLIRQIR